MFRKLTCESMGTPVETWTQVVDQPPDECGQTVGTTVATTQTSLSRMLLPNLASKGFRFLQVGSLGFQPNHIGVRRESNGSLDGHLYAGMIIIKSNAETAGKRTSMPAVQW